MSKLEDQLSQLRRRRAERQADAAAHEQARNAPKIDALRQRLIVAVGAEVVEALEEAAPFTLRVVRYSNPALGIQIGDECWRLYWWQGILSLMSPNSKVDRGIDDVRHKPGSPDYRDAFLEQIEWILASQARRASRKDGTA